MNINDETIDKQIASVQIKDNQYLIEQNNKLSDELFFMTKSLNVLQKFKSFLDEIYDKFVSKLDSQQIQKLKQLEDEYKYILEQSQPNHSNVNNLGIILKSNSDSNVNCIKNDKTKQKGQNLINDNKIICDINTSNHKQSVNHLNEASVNSTFIKIEPFIKPKSNAVSDSLFKCPHIGCDKTFMIISDLEKHRSEHNNKRLRSHQINEHLDSNIKAIDKCFKCDFIGCDYKTTLRYRIIDHKNRHIGLKPFKCTYDGCDKAFVSRGFLNQHIKTVHTLEKTVNYYECDYIGCDYKTSRKDELMPHKNRHEGLAPYKCTEEGCSKAFAGPRHLQRHIRITHNLKKTFKCEFFNCGKKFKTIAFLNTHMKRHTNYEKPFVCDYPNCDFRARYKGDIGLHKTSHSTERPFKCSFQGCLKDYKTKYDLKCHSFTHTMEFSFKCQFNGCKSIFKTKDHLRKHEFYVHKNVDIACDWPGCEFKTKRPLSMKRHKSTHSDGLNFSCDWPECGKKFKTDRYLKLHLRIHKNDKRYACHWPGCQYRCVDSGNIRKHIKIHEKNSSINIS